MSQEDIRWIQRFNNFSKALSQLRKFIAKGELGNIPGTQYRLIKNVKKTRHVAMFVFYSGRLQGMIKTEIINYATHTSGN